MQGPLTGNQQLLKAFDEWIPKSRELDRAEGIAELVLRYMLSHGPATERDFAWWSNTPVTEVRSALATVKDQLAELEFEGTSYWMAPATAALLDDVVAASVEQERLETWIMGEVNAGAALPGLYPPNDANKARYEQWAAGMRKTD